MTMSASPRSAGWWAAWTFLALLALIGLVAIMARARRPDEARYKRMRSDSFYNEGEADTKYWRIRYDLSQSQRQRRGAPAFDLGAMATAVRGKAFDPWHPGA